ncbi:hypothetical protein D3C87_720190 [compost metagenome]
MRKILSFVSPELGITYQELYGELADRAETSFEEVTRRFPPDEAVTALQYHRRMAERRQVYQQLAERLGVSADVVFSACTTDGARKLLDALDAKDMPLAAAR